MTMACGACSIENGQKVLFIAYRVRHLSLSQGARCSSVVRAFARGAMGRRIDP